MVTPLQFVCLFIQRLIVKKKCLLCKVVCQNFRSCLVLSWFLISLQITHAQISSDTPAISPASSLDSLFNSDTYTQAEAPTALCPNSNFSTGDFSNWEGFYGSFSDPAEYPGFITFSQSPRHLIIQAPGTQDANTCDGLVTVPPGEAYAARLGNDNNGAEAEQLRYTLTVSDESNLFIYKYAVVFEDPDHAPEDQPSFTIEITNDAGEVFDSACGYYYVYARPDLPGWNICNNSDTRVVWKDWTTVGLDLSPYVGQTITIVFTTRDCNLSAHYGYAYLSTTCSKLKMSVYYCPQNEIVSLTVPPGFSYLWSNGSTAQSTTIVNPIPGIVDSCVLTSVNGCKVTIHASINPTKIKANFQYVSNRPNCDVPFFDLSTINQNAVVDWEWNWGDGTPEVTHNPNPRHKFTNWGNYNVRLIVYSTEGCVDTITKEVIVERPSTIWFSNAFSPNGDGKNDVFLPEAINVGKFHMSIFNRYGQLLFETYSTEKGWDGSANGVICPAEVYVYVATYELLDVAETKSTKGTVTLVR